MSALGSTYTYKRYMRDGSVEERVGVIRSRSKKVSARALALKEKKEKKNND